MGIKKIQNSRCWIMILVLIICFSASGCSKIDDLKIKSGLKNKDFEYVNQGKVKSVVIQSTRDQGFRFTVTDKNVIGDLYDMLSTAKIANKKSKLEPDYIFEITEEDNKVHKFNYITGLDKTDSSNLYNDNKMYIVSKRIDSNIINYYWTIRKPNNFKDVYYKSIIDTLNQYIKEPKKNSKIGINLKDDVESAKFILSTELEDFKSDLNSKLKNASVANKDKENYHILC